MRMTRFALIALPAAAAVAAATLPFTANAATSGHQTATVHKTAGSDVAVYDCANQPQVRPGEFDIFCDGSGAIIHLNWSSWNTSMGTATGVEYIDNCVPNCASGKFSHQNVDLVFWDSKPVKGHSGHYGYTKMTTLFPSSGKTYTQTPPGAFPGEF